MNKLKARKASFTDSDLLKQLVRYRFIYLLLLPATFFVILFSYVPMTGIKMAFQDYNIYDPAASTWIGLENFKEIFRIKECINGIKNTFIIGILSLVICYPLTIIFALLLNEIRNSIFKKVVQTISYLPHFLSWISVIGIVTSIYSQYGLVNDVMVALTGGAHERVSFLAVQDFFIPNVIILTLWKTIGWNSVIFLAAMTGIDQSLYEAAEIDGASKFSRVLHITIPGIMPTIMIMLLWRIAALFTDNFELI